MGLRAAPRSELHGRELPAVGSWMDRRAPLPQPSFTAVPEAVTISIEPPWPTVS
jgi:hypothetical protein